MRPCCGKRYRKQKLQATSLSVNNAELWEKSPFWAFVKGELTYSQKSSIVHVTITS